MSPAQKYNLEKQLWAIADILRGKMNADEYKNYILGFIFTNISETKRFTFY
ncbi:TPA: type I restriction-modification system subunit M N-terminal domain-containing protein [Candidatus Gracilibacteria bacterium]|nr:hypothetical protein [Candidatus Peregrinibacteria bacterium]HIQ56905.1 type I restriction-modification system subunit M N-terminal domain-containing protein [Candidatus Gracilibacteria bacterium]HIQ57083.1 type I restriction-modification system subunit M N-terminal domain-containing protein [Candidatus Gracilibacteria bacterium]